MSTTNGRCGTCQHWAEGAQAIVYSGADPAYGDCQRIGSADDQRFRDSTVLAFADSSEGIGGAWLQTRAEFGCVLFERTGP